MYVIYKDKNTVIHPRPKMDESNKLMRDSSGKLVFPTTDELLADGYLELLESTETEPLKSGFKYVTEYEKLDKYVVRRVVQVAK